MDDYELAIKDTEKLTIEIMKFLANKDLNISMVSLLACLVECLNRSEYSQGCYDIMIKNLEQARQSSTPITKH